jgi:hypothetical protein
LLTVAVPGLAFKLAFELAFAPAFELASELAFAPAFGLVPFAVLGITTRKSLAVLALTKTLENRPEES